MRQERTRALRLADRYGIEIERRGDGGLNVWPPRALAFRDGFTDPYAASHYAIDWADALERAQAYVRIMGEKK